MTTTPLESLRALLRERTGRVEERAILQHLREAQDLDHLLSELDLRRLLSALDDRVLGPDHRSAALDLLTLERVDALGPLTRAKLVSALQAGRTGARDEDAIHALILSTAGEALTRLKNAVDCGGDHRDLLQLVEHDIDNPGLRRDILEHIDTQAQALPCCGRKVLSDIDDTFYANWKDRRYPKKTVYPGVLAFYEALADERLPPPASRVTFITARPQERSGLVERAAMRSLNARGLEPITVLSGSLRNLHSNAAIARKKIDNFQAYAALYPEYRFTFVGDSGQGDATLAAEMLTTHPEQVEATFIHDVVGVPAERREALAAAGVYCFDTYAGAAQIAHALGLVSDEARERVCEATRAEHEALEFEDAEQAEAARRALEADLSG